MDRFIKIATMTAVFGIALKAIAEIITNAAEEIIGLADSASDREDLTGMMGPISETSEEISGSSVRGFRHLRPGETRPAFPREDLSGHDC